MNRMIEQRREIETDAVNYALATRRDFTPAAQPHPEQQEEVSLRTTVRADLGKSAVGGEVPAEARIDLHEEVPSGDNVDYLDSISSARQRVADSLEEAA